MTFTISCCKNAANRRLVTALERNQLHESVEALFNRQFGTSSALASLRAHCRIFDLIERSKIDEAQAALTAHLEQTAPQIAAQIAGSVGHSQTGNRTLAD